MVPVLLKREPAGEEILAAVLEDLHLVKRVECALRATGYGALRYIEVIVQDRVAILKGRVPSYYLKQAAQTIAQSVPGIHQIHNDLEVVS